MYRYTGKYDSRWAEPHDAYKDGYISTLLAIENYWIEKNPIIDESECRRLDNLENLARQKQRNDFEKITQTHLTWEEKKAWIAGQSTLTWRRTQAQR